MRKSIVVVLLFIVCCSSGLRAQGESAVPFLLITASPSSNGLGQTSAGLPINDPLIVFDNPAQLGFLALHDYASYSFTRLDWFPQFQQADLYLRNYAVQAGINLRTINPAMPDLAIGFSKSQLYLSLGTFQITNNSPDPNGSFDAYEQSDMSSVGVALRYGLTVSAGLTHKNIYSQLAPINVQGQGRLGIAYVASYDIGMLAEAPLMDLLERAGVRCKIGKLNPLVNLSAGFSRNNMGESKVFYIDAAQADPLPRFVRVGIGVQLGLNYDLSENEQWKLINCSWTAEANDMLVRRYPAVYDSSGEEIAPSRWEYLEGFGDIQFAHELLTGQSNDETIRKRGWEINLADIVLIRGGRFDESLNHGNRHFSMSGMTLRTGGVWKMFRASGVLTAESSWFLKLLNHMDFSYSHAEWDPDDHSHPFAGTKQDGWMLSITN